ncbi:MAG TPA: M1 family metallopeptidase, partial [Polyangiaceae bacterium]|nr:M1 family metallopeptidase [Polyangiaceae bacterium]
LNLSFKFRAKLPPILARTGHAEGFHMVAQWYPKLARLEPDGRFAHFAFHPHSEFYADFGRYDVQLDVASDLIVGATGKLTKSEARDGRTRLHYRADNVHDFAWCAWAQFHTQTRQIDGTRVTLLFPPGHDHNANVTFSVLSGALPNMSRRFGRYPHETLTVVHTPDFAPAAGGMEYPALITTGGQWWSAYTGVRLVESLTVHELGHQWFQGLVASDESKYPFLDEGLTSYVEQSTLEDLYGAASFARILDFSLTGNALRRAVAARVAHDDLVAQPASSFSSFSSIGGLVYSRTATILETLARVYGRDRLDRALGRYARAHRFGHPTPSDLLDALESVLGESARQFAKGAFFERGFIDFVAELPESVPVRKPAGRFGAGTAAETIAPDVAADAKRSSRVIIRR